MIARREGPPQDWSSPEEASPEGGFPSVYSCPECHGVLAKVGADDLPRFVCRVGHAYDLLTLLDEDETAAEQAIWTAIRAGEERLSLTRRVHRRAQAIGDREQEQALAQRIEDVERQVARLRSALGRDEESSSRAPPM